MKTAWILLLCSFFHKTNAMEDDIAKIETEKISDEDKIKTTVSENDESKIEPVTSKKRVQLSDAEAEDLREKFKILMARKDSEESKLDLQFSNHVPNTRIKMQETDIAALQPRKLYFMLEKRYTTGIERQRLLQKFLKSLQFGGVMFGEKSDGSKYAVNIAVTFPRNSISFYKENFDNDFYTKKIEFQFHWNCKCFPLLIEYDNKKFLFRYLYVAKKTRFFGEKGIYFFYFNVNTYTFPSHADGIRIIFDDIIFDSQGKRPSFKVQSSNGVREEVNMTPIEASKMIDDAVWFNVEEIQKEVTKQR